jgi:hypothetical protein
MQEVFLCVRECDGHLLQNCCYFFQSNKSQKEIRLSCYTDVIKTYESDMRLNWNTLYISFEKTRRFFLSLYTLLPEHYFEIDHGGLLPNPCILSIHDHLLSSPSSTYLLRQSNHQDLISVQT